jgi:hypothetical protein
MSAETTLAFGLFLSVFSVAVLGLMVNWLSAGLLAFTIFFYAVIYTMWLKRSTPHNIVIGGAAGAFPPIIGWACVTNSISLESIALFAIIFLWTPAAFLGSGAVQIRRLRPGGRAHAAKCRRRTGHQEPDRSLCGADGVSGVVPSLMGFAGVVYGVVAAVLGAAFIWYSRPRPGDARWRREDDPGQEAVRLFAALSVRHLYLASGGWPGVQILRRGDLIMDKVELTEQQKKAGVRVRWRLALRWLSWPSFLRGDDHQDRPRHLEPADVRRNAMTSDQKDVKDASEQARRRSPVRRLWPR